MFKHILHTEVQAFIKNFQGTISQLAFSGSPFKDVTIQELLVQIESRIKAKTKLPTWYETKGVIFPPKLNLEQTSSETTAAYKSALVSGNTIADITGGFGIDSHYFAKSFKEVQHFELQAPLSKIVNHNATCLGDKNITCTIGNGLEGIKHRYFDVIYADPSRRHDQKGKVFLLKDCEPNIPLHLKYLLERCTTLLIKTSPMLDIYLGIQELSYVNEIHIVAVQNEVKELLWVLSKKEVSSPEIHTINYTNKEAQKFYFTWGTSDTEILSTPKKYLYEPNAAILKSGAFSSVCHHYNISKLHKHSHLYTHDTLIAFPGRTFIIDKIVPYSKKEMRDGNIFDKANITTRNFPESVAQLRKKWHIKDGGDRYLFFTTIENEKKIVLICSKTTHEV